MTERAHFGKIGAILATAGSAVGLGNIWRFPYMTGQDGGAAFIILYLVCVLMLGIPGMTAEFIVGRHGSSNAARAYQSFGRGRAWGLVGYMGIFTSTIILGFYAVVAGWCAYYLGASLLGGVNGSADEVKAYFTQFSSDPVKPALCALLFIFITHVVVTRGVRRGIERASNLLMPTLVVLLIIIVIASCSLPGSGKGVEFLFHPDFSKLDSNVMLDALGQAFFSLSLGTACLCTYASYFSRQTNLLKSASQIAVIDTAIAIMAGLMIFPAAFSVGVNPDSGPSLIFITLPNVFGKAFASVPWLGYIVSILFYALLSLAALTSTISMHEIGTVFFQEELHTSRSKAACIITLWCSVVAVVCSLSCGAVDITLFGLSALDFCDFLTSNILLPLGALATCIYVGWIIPTKTVRNEFTNWGTVGSSSYLVWLFMVRVVTPVCVVAVFLHQLKLI